MALLLITSNKILLFMISPILYTFLQPILFICFNRRSLKIKNRVVQIIKLYSLEIIIHYQTRSGALVNLQTQCRKVVMHRTLA